MDNSIGGDNMKLEERGTLRILTPEVGYKLYCIPTNSYITKAYLGVNDSIDNYKEIAIELLGEQQPETLETMKEKRIKLSKDNLAKYLEENPLLSTVKHEEGRYYNVTMEKQNLLLSNISTYQMSSQLGIPCSLTWNDTGEECELWTIEQLIQLSMEIRSYVAPLVSLQQYMEVNIKKCETNEELINVNVDFTEEAINEFMPLYIKKFGDANEQ